MTIEMNPKQEQVQHPEDAPQTIQQEYRADLLGLTRDVPPSTTQGRETQGPDDGENL